MHRLHQPRVPAVEARSHAKTKRKRLDLNLVSALGSGSRREARVAWYCSGHRPWSCAPSWQSSTRKRNRGVTCVLYNSVAYGPSSRHGGLVHAWVGQIVLNCNVFKT